MCWCVWANEAQKKIKSNKIKHKRIRDRVLFKWNAPASQIVFQLWTKIPYKNTFLPFTISFYFIFCSFLFRPFSRKSRKLLHFERFVSLWWILQGNVCECVGGSMWMWCENSCVVDICWYFPYRSLLYIRCTHLLYTHVYVYHIYKCVVFVEQWFIVLWVANDAKIPAYTLYSHTHTHRPIPMPTNTHIYAHKECHQFKISSQIMALASAICCSVDGVRCAAIAAAVVDNVDQSL